LSVKHSSSFFRTIWIVNAKGSGRLAKTCSWSFTVDATIYTFSPIDNERLEGLAHLAGDLSGWLASNFGFHHSTFDTVGTSVDAPVSREDSRGIGFYFVSLDVEDVTMARGDYRSRRDIGSVNAEMLVESERDTSYSIVGCKVKPRLALDVRLHVGETLRELIREGIRRAVARVLGR
jgi:hypothetical protein